MGMNDDVFIDFENKKKDVKLKFGFCVLFHLNQF